ncbi:nuclear transport factor 2 family protein [Hyphobacterium sp.]|uniref:nuclear transport factor 2 family protein n=1 Tax=Hyphobacterium sp. TaxID=2004662 RepID=UPI003BAC7AB7
MRAYLTALMAAIALAVPAHADDDAAIDAVIDDLYAVISGGVGEARDWDRFRSLYLPGATMSVASPGEAGTGSARIITPEEYIESNGPVLSEIGFTESETGRAVYRYGGMATVLTAYEATRADRDELFLTGVNTIVLMRVEGEWKIASIAWRNGPPIPVEDAFINRAE